MRYALRFERAFKTDVWEPVEASFAPDATYTIAGSDTEWDGVTRGARDIVALFKRMLDALDRKYDRRSPRPDGWPRLDDGALVVPWRARYVLGSDEVMLHGTSRCRFDTGNAGAGIGGIMGGRRITELSDTMTSPAECRRWGELAGITVR